MYKDPNPKYKFRLFVDGTESEVFPFYGENSTRVLQREEGQVFFRPKITGDFEFKRLDFALINDADFDAEFILHIDRRKTDSTYTVDWWKGKFSKTDCSFDGDECSVSVNPNTDDLYREILEGMEKEYNVVELVPEFTRVNLEIQPLIQIYWMNANRITNFLAGVFWEEDTLFASANLGDLINNYFFEEGSVTHWFIPGESGANLDPDVSGTYSINVPYIRTDGHYKIVQVVVGLDDQWQILDILDSDNIVYAAPLNETMGAGGIPGPNNFGTIFSSLTSSSECRAFFVRHVMRLLCNEDFVQGDPTNDIPDEDIVAPNSLYSKVIGITYDKFLSYDGNQSDPEQFGRFDLGAVNFAEDYFKNAVFSPATGITRTYPLGRSEWLSFGLWFYYDAPLRQLQEDGGTERILKHCYALDAIIQAFLNKISPGLTHEATAEYSDFFYATTNLIRGARKYPVFAPKANVIFNEYDKPAEVSMATFADFLRFLADFYQVFWYLDGTKFKLEHIDFFDRGKTYVGTNVGTDVTGLYDPKSGLKWSARENKYKFEKQNIPDRITHEWMDTVSEPFIGFPLEMRSKYAQKGNISARKLSIFTSDVDMIQGSPSLFSIDGFVFLECEADGNEFRVPFVVMELEYPKEYKMQNGWASIIYAHENYWRFHLPSSLITLNELDQTANTIRPNRIQEIGFPEGDVEPDPMELITTELGTGKVKEMTLNLTKGDLKITIEHATE